MRTFPVLLLIAGCSYGGYRDETDALTKRAREHSAWTPSPEGSSSELERRLLALGDAVPPPPKPGLEDYVRAALTRNPGLRAAVKRLEAAIERVPQAASAPEPELEIAFRFEDFFKNLLSFMVQLMQPVLFPGKLEARARMAVADAWEEWEMLQEKALAIRAEVAMAVAELFALDHALRIAGENRTLIEQLESVARTRYEARQVPQQDVLKVRLRALALENSVIRMTRERREAETRLNALLGRPDMSPVATPPAPPEPADPEALDALFARALERRPELAAMTHRLRGSLARLSMAALEAWPDVVPGVEVERMRGGDWEVEPKLTVPLPLLRTGRVAAARAEARALLGEAWHRYEGARVEVARQVAAAHARVIETRASIQLYRDKLRPQAKQTYEAALAGYRAGEVDFLTSVDALIEFQDVEEQYHRLLGDHLAAREALRRAVGEVQP